LICAEGGEVADYALVEEGVTDFSAKIGYYAVVSTEVAVRKTP